MIATPPMLSGRPGSPSPAAPSSAGPMPEPAPAPTASLPPLQIGLAELTSMGIENPQPGDTFEISVKGTVAASDDQGVTFDLSDLSVETEDKEKSEGEDSPGDMFDAAAGGPAYSV